MHLLQSRRFFVPQSDIETATRIAESMVRMCGMGSESVGPVEYLENPREGWQYSEATKAVVESEVRQKRCSAPLLLFISIYFEAMPITKQSKMWTKM